MSKVQFQKKPLDLDAQVALLRERGLVIRDPERIKHYLNFVGYYRLSGYFRHFINVNDERKDIFREDVSFQDVLNLYIFDRKLRNMLMDAFERIEIALKSSMSNTIATQKGAFWLCDAGNFDYGKYDQVLKIIDDSIAIKDGKSQHIFINHFYRKYNGPYPPCWMIFEGMSFGGVSRIYKLMKGSVRADIAREFGIQHDVFESWLHALTFGRNVCAHHSRLWNRTFTIKPKVPKIYAGVWPEDAKDRLYVLCCIVKHMMNVIADGTQWPVRLKILIDERPEAPLPSMGFPENWARQEFWELPGGTNIQSL